VLQLIRRLWTLSFGLLCIRRAARNLVAQLINGLINLVLCLLSYFAESVLAPLPVLATLLGGVLTVLA